MRILSRIAAGLACITLLAAAAPTMAAGQSPGRPNILFILADDWGWGDLSCHGSKVVNTPNLDQFAREGTEFYQFNTCSPVCSPSRTAFMTGQFPARWGVHEAIGGPEKNREVG
jgi:arylsulfatase A-like enzyme